MENRIKECQLHLFADRTSAATMKANQLRLWFASMAFVLLATLLSRDLDESFEFDFYGLRFWAGKYEQRPSTH